MGTKILKAYGVGAPLIDVMPIPVDAQRAPTPTDNQYPPGQIWRDVSLLPSPPNLYFWNGKTWILLGVGGGSLNTLTGDDSVAVLPNGTNINVQGGGSGAVLFGSGGLGQLNAQVQVDGTSIVINGSNQLSAAGVVVLSATTVNLVPQDVTLLAAADFLDFSAVSFSCQVIGYDAANNECSGGEQLGIARKSLGVVTVIGTNDTFVEEDFALSPCQWDAIASGGNLIFRFIGVGATTIDWKVKFEFTIVP